MSDLYDEDIVLWSERQAELLRRVAAGEQLNESGLDWPNIIEEIESLGRSDVHAVESLIVQSLLHTLKAQAWPQSGAVPGWQAEARRFRDQARRRFSPSMRQRIDLAGLYRDVLRAMPDTIGGRPPLPLPPVCPTTLDELLSLKP